MRRAASDAKVPHVVQRVGSMLTLFFNSEPVHNYEDAKRSDVALFGRFFWEMLARGVYLPCSQFEAAFVSAAHTEADIDHTIDAARDALRAIVQVEPLIGQVRLLFPEYPCWPVWNQGRVDWRSVCYLKREEEKGGGKKRREGKGKRGREKRRRGKGKGEKKKKKEKGGGGEGGGRRDKKKEEGGGRGGEEGGTDKGEREG